MTPPDDGFYDWITTAEGYYPEYRPEWDLFFDEIGANPGAPQDILVDVGCGSGKFLEAARKRTNLRVIGLDFSEPSVRACNSRGLEAYTANAEDGLPFASSGVRHYTLWHIVEHVQDPKKLLHSLAENIVDDGSIVFSVPLSPTSAEVTTCDPLNLPPHHLTRWSIKSLDALAQELGMSMHLFFPPAKHFLIRALLSFRLQSLRALTGHWSRHLKLLCFLALHPAKFIREMIRQLQRKKVEGKDLPDVIMVRLTKSQQNLSAPS